MATYSHNAITVLKMTTVNSSVAVSPTLAEMSSATGLYIDCKHIDASKMILVFTRETSGANTASKNKLVISHGGDTAGYSGYGLGACTVIAASAIPSTEPATGELNCQFCGPFETARFKDSDGYIKILSTRGGVNITAVGAILI